MGRTRMTFRQIFSVTPGTPVMNDLGHEVGFVVGCERVPDSGVQQRHAGHIIDGPLWEVTADIDNTATKGKLQCFEPTLPIP